MNATMQRRLDAIKRKLEPPRCNRVAVVYLPTEGDPPEEWERYHEEMAVDADVRIVVEYE
jgi:hypothetical protein